MMDRFIIPLKTGWTLRRFIGLAIALFISIQSILLWDPVLGLLSIVFLYQIITNTGCLGSQSCTVNNTKFN